MEKVTFAPQVGLHGFRVVSSFDINLIACSDLSSEVFQLGLILYPPEFFNEKFLIKMRDCILKLHDNHPVKNWLKWVAKSRSPTPKEQKLKTFLHEILNSQFNLITDLKVKSKIIEALTDVPEKTLYEKLLKSYLYLMIGNVTHSDNILKGIINQPPLMNWIGYTTRNSIYHHVSQENIKQIFQKLARHPSDRKTFELLELYFDHYFNDSALLEDVSENETGDLKNLLGLKYIERMAPDLIHYLRLEKLSENTKMKRLRDTSHFPVRTQIYWIWPFMDIDPLISQNLVSELEELHIDEQLWFLYLMDNEKLADAYAKKSGKSFLPGKRHYLRELLKKNDFYMLSLFKLLEFGDIDKDLVNQTSQFLSHE